MEFNKAPNIIGLKVLNDNVIWIWIKDKSVVVVDPSVHEPVIRFRIWWLSYVVGG